MEKEMSYIYGLLLADGNLYLTTRNRGRISLEIKEIDEDIVDKLIKLIPNSKKTRRTRNTNFKNNFTSVSFKNFQKDFRNMIIGFGYPLKNKAENIKCPEISYSEIDFWRGVIDGDGSLGFTSMQEPFISLITKSEQLKDDYLQFLNKQLNIIKKINRNKRDNCYNIIVKNKDAINLAKILYYKDCLGINRKIQIAKNILKQVNDESI